MTRKVDYGVAYPARLQRRPPDHLRPGPLGAVRPRRRQPGRRLARLHALADQQGHRRQVEPGQRQPAAALVRAGHARSSPTYVNEYPGAQKFFDNLANAKQARPTVDGYAEMSRYVGEAIAEVLQGAASPKEALDEAAKQVGRGAARTSDHDVRTRQPPAAAGAAGDPPAAAAPAGGRGAAPRRRPAGRSPARRRSSSSACRSSRRCGRSSSRGRSGTASRRPRDVGWGNYQRMAQDPDLRAAVGHTLVLTALFVPRRSCSACSSRSR